MARLVEGAPACEVLAGEFGRIGEVVMVFLLGPGAEEADRKFPRSFL